MKRHILLSILGCLAIIGGANATTREKSEIPRTPVTPKHEIIGEMTVNGRTFKVVKPEHSQSKVHTRAESTPIIDKAPGTVQYYCKDAVGYGQGMPIQAYAYAANINWDGNDAYFEDIITAAPMGTYVKATLDGNALVLPMNQTVWEFDDEEYDLSLGLLRPVFTTASDSDGDQSIMVWFEYSDDYDEISYVVGSNGSLEPVSPKAKYTNDGPDASYYGFPDYVIGYYYTDDYSWSGYCDVFQYYDEFNFEKVELPENLDMYTLTYINMAGMGVIVSLGETEDAVFIKGLSAYAPETVLKADIIENGSKLSVAPNQFIGIEYDSFYVVTSTVTEESLGKGETVDRPAYFDIERDATTGKITSIKAEDSEYFLAFNDDPFYFYPVDMFPGLELSLQETFEGIPSTPTKAYYEDYSTMMGANFVFFRLSSFAYNGDIIDVNNLYYSIYINGDIVEFEEQEGLNLMDEVTVMYRGLKEPTTLVPYTFANDIDLYEDMGGTFVVGLYAEGIETVGVQAVYICGDTTTTSGLVTIDTATGEQTVTPGTDTKVESINSTDILGVEYFNLQGQKITHPEKGIYLKKCRLSDGSIKTVKVMIR